MCHYNTLYIEIPCCFFSIEILIRPLAVLSARPKPCNLHISDMSNSRHVCAESQSPSVMLREGVNIICDHAHTQVWGGGSNHDYTSLDFFFFNV